jgi:hypothetical protein
MRLIDERLTTDLIALAFILPIQVMSATARARFHREPADANGNHSLSKIPGSLDASANN